MGKQTLLCNAGVITMDSMRHQYNDGAVFIDGDRILKIGPTQELLPGLADEVETVDLQGRWILPGLINTHVHTSQHLARGLGDDVTLLTWLHDRIWPYESNMTEEDSYISSLLCILEQIQSGVTCFAEPGGQHVAGMARAVSESGVRACLARSTMDIGEGLTPNWRTETTHDALEKQICAYEEWHGKAEGRIRIWLGLRTIFNNSDDLIVKTKELADSLNTGIHMHVGEIKDEIDYSRRTRGATTVEHLHRMGVLAGNFLAVHCVWLTDAEIQMFSECDVKVSHNPAAGMRYLGFAKIPEMIDRGICVSLGTDGAPSNNRMTLIDEMWLASLIHKGRLLDPTVMQSQVVLEMTTCSGARAVLWEDEIGSIEAGKKADLIVVNPNTATMLPLHDPVANMVTAMRTENVESVMVNGNWVMRDGDITTIDKQGIIEEAKQRAAHIVNRAGIKLPNRFNVVD
jgi:5-methylthioadenosine/S-adenosylhomocysteine deaminase